MLVEQGKIRLAVHTLILICDFSTVIKQFVTTIPWCGNIQHRVMSFVFSNMVYVKNIFRTEMLALFGKHYIVAFDFVRSISSVTQAVIKCFQKIRYSNGICFQLLFLNA